MTVHETSKANVQGDGRLWWEAHCTCGWERNVKLESEAVDLIDDHEMAVRQEQRRLISAYKKPLPDDGITP